MKLLPLLQRPVLALCLLATAGLAQATIPIEQWQHASGARVSLINSPSLPMLDVQIDFDGGRRRDPATQVGLANATASLLSGGVAAQPGLPALDENQLGEAWADLGAQFGADATLDRFNVSLRTLTEPDLLERAVALAARQLAAPAWPERVWQRDRERLVAALQEAENRPGTQASRAFSTAVFGKHPYGFRSDAKTLRTISVADMRKFYRRHVMSCGAQVSMVGAVDRSTADRIVGRLMAALQPHGCQALPEMPPVLPLTQAVDQRLPFAAAQAQVLIGQPGVPRNDPDFFALFVGNYVLGGGGFVSRLMSEVREQRGLTYGVSSYFVNGRQAGAFQIALTTRPDQATQAVEVVREVVRKFVAEGPTEAELQAAKDYLVNGEALRLDSNRKLLDNVANIAWNDLPLNYLDTWTSEVQRLSTADIQRAFARVLQPDRMVTVVVGGK
ncbi:M16 family metallopeptidase [Hydrogenophaga palleronii]|uniref:M16 family metallopeptidase n=1 Tax=Hydrogenophaga palleronii TaxID=65655 RepID=UPI000824950C|nr:pitrilysin family protein [Hydrogenophaga palleronii]